MNFKWKAVGKYAIKNELRVGFKYIVASPIDENPKLFTYLGNGNWKGDLDLFFNDDNQRLYYCRIPNNNSELWHYETLPNEFETVIVKLKNQIDPVSVYLYKNKWRDINQTYELNEVDKWCYFPSFQKNTSLKEDDFLTRSVDFSDSSFKEKISRVKQKFNLN